MKVQQILDRKLKNQIIAVTPDTIVFNALEVLEKHNIGALLVMEGEQLVGIFSERDFARRGILKGKPSRESQVKDLMTTPVITVSPQAKIEECLTIMTERHFRHLPVVEDRVSLKIANEAPKNAKRNKIRLVFFIYAFDRG
jgi:CBS domain-containing protein